MVTTYLAGGLGNQMFQIAVALVYAKKYDDEVAFDLNNSHTPFQGSNVSKYKDKLFKFKHLDDIYDLCENEFSQPGHSYCDIPYKKNQLLQGFFQSDKFFDGFSDYVKNIFLTNLKEEYKDEWDVVMENISNLKKSINKPIVCIHVRRGDYLKFPHVYTLCSVGYYNEAIDIMKSKIGDFHIYFVSDDIKWCKDTFGIEHSFSKYVDEIYDMILMINCDHNIIANSSFSWWGSYLNDDNKVVIGPKKWFGPSGPKDQEDTLPTKWIKI